MNQLLIATTNPGKKKEILSALLPLQGTEILDLNDLGIDMDVEENGTSYGENALIKARAYYDAAGIPTIAEDSGIEVAALAGELGIHTRRWGPGLDASDAEWLEHFMERMAAEEERAARFVSHAVYIDDTGHFPFEGECRGHITHKVEGPIHYGIPLSAVFRPEGEELVYSAMEEDQKNALSHRGWAVKGLRDWYVNR